MVSFHNIFLFATAAAAATTLSKRLTTISKVIDDVTAIDVNVRKLITETNAYEGGILGATPQLADLTAVYLALGTGVLDSGLLPPKISVPDTNRLIVHVNKTLAIDNPIAVDTLIDKKPLYKEAGLEQAIVAALELLLAGHLQFTRNVLVRAPESTIKAGKEVTDVITFALQKGIDTFKN